MVVVLGVDALDDRLEPLCQLRVDPPNLAADGPEDTRGEAFGELQHDVAHDGVGDDDVSLGVEHAAPLDVADEVDRGIRAQQVAGLLNVSRAFLLLPAHVHQGDAGLRNAQPQPGVDLAHHTVLGEVMGLGLEVRPDVDQRDGPGERRQCDGDPRPMNGGQPPQEHLGGGNERPGVAGGNHRVKRVLGLAAGEPRQDDHRGILLGSHGLDGRLPHPDHVGAAHDGDPRIVDVPVGQELLDHGCVADQNDLVVFSERAQGGDRTFKNRVRGVVAAHHVEADPHRSLAFSRLDLETRSNVSARRACLVRPLGRPAVRAQNGVYRIQRVVRPALALAAGRCSESRNSHI